MAWSSRILSPQGKQKHVVFPYAPFHEGLDLDLEYKYEAILHSAVHHMPGHLSLRSIPSLCAGATDKGLTSICKTIWTILSVGAKNAERFLE